MLNIDRKGTVVIRQGNDNQQPIAVYVGGVNGFDMLVCKELNTSNIYFSMPEEDDLLDFDFKLLQKLRAEWDLDASKRNTERLQQRIEEGKY